MNGLAAFISLPKESPSLLGRGVDSPISLYFYRDYGDGEQLAKRAKHSGAIKQDLCGERDSNP